MSETTATNPEVMSMQKKLQLQIKYRSIINMFEAHLHEL